MGENEEGFARPDWNPQCPASGHSDEVFSVNFSPDGKRFVSGSADNIVKIWNAETGDEVSSFVGLHRVW
jgi:WD40 repeat protein